MPEIILSTLPFIYLLLVGSITPGPNNVMLTASGMNFGYLKTIPHMLGVYIGFIVLMLLCTFGVGALVAAYPQVLIGIQVLGGAYLLYLAWRIFNGGRVGVNDQAEKTVRPLNFWEAFTFQFINPKAVVFGLAATALLPEGVSMFELGLLVVVAVTLTCPLSVNVWTLFGKAVAKLFRDDKIRRIINAVLALLLLATLPMMVL